MSEKPAASLRAVLLLFFLSGATGLLYQVVWVRGFVHVFGATVLAVSTVLAAFMGGLALGGLAGGRIVRRVRNPLRLYGLLECALAVLAGLVPTMVKLAHPLYAGLYPSLADSFWALSAVRFGVSMLILIPPTFLMGATLPLLTAHAESAARDAEPGWIRRRVAHLYAVNTFGAVAGTAAASFVLLPGLGLRMTLFAGVALNVLVGLAAIVLAGRSGSAAAAASVPAGAAAGTPEDPATSAAPAPAAAGSAASADSAPAPIARPALLAAAGVLGFSALALEVLWTRTLTLALGTTTYAFALVLTAFLLGIAGGSAIAARLLRRPRRAAALFAAAPAAVGLLALAIVPVFDRLPDLFVRLTAGGSGTWLQGLAVMFGVAALPMLLPTLVSGAAFPLAVGIDRAAGGAGRSVGDVYASNTLGAILGSWAAGFLLIPQLGLREGIVLAGSIQIAMTVALLLAWRGPRKGVARGAGIALAVIAAVVVLALPDWNRAALTRGGFAVAADLRRYGLTELAVDRSEIVFFEEGIATTVTVRRWSDELTMQMNGVTEASNTGDLATQVMIGGLGALLHPEPRDALVIGLGSGITAAATARHPGVETVDCVEISEAVAHAAELFREANHGVLDDPRVRLVVGDGRNHLSLSGRTFDVIVSQPSNVWVSGTGALMTREFYGMCREHLRPGGILCAWIQGYSITSRELRAVLAAVRAHFPQVTLWSAGWGDLAIVAGDESFRIDAQRLLDKATAHEEIRALLRESDAPDLVSLLSRNLLAGSSLDRYVGDAPPNTDDNLILEFQAPKLLYRETVRELFESLHAAAGGTEELLASAPEGLADALPRARRARELESAGRLLFREGRGEEGLRRIEEARHLLPGDPAIGRVLAQALNGRGETMARHGDAQDARDQYLQAAEADPGWGEPLANLARLYLRANRPDPAEAAAADALRLSPGKPDYLTLRAEIRNHTRFHAGARDDAEAALAMDPAFHDAFVVLAEALQGLREWDAADSVLAAGLRRHPDSEQLLQARRDLEARKRKTDTAARNVPGRWNEFRTRRFDPDLSDEERAAVEKLEAVGYLGGTREAAAAADQGVVLHDAARAQAGWNLYTSGHAPAAWLMDMNGEVRHEWRYDFRRIWPDYPVASAQPDAQFWRRVLLLPDGGLIAIFEGLGILRLDRDSGLVWANPVRAHHDLQLLPGDELFVLTRESNLDGPQPVLEDFVSVLDVQDGTEKRRVSVLEAVRESDFAELLLKGANRDGDVLHTNSLQVLDGRAASRVPALAAGNVLVSFRITDAIAVLDLKARRAVWAKRADWSAQHDARFLPDGNLTLFDNGMTREASRALEMDPRTMNVVWSYDGGDQEPLFTNTCGTAQRLENGNTLITESDRGRALEVTRDGTTVWEFLSPHRTGEGGRYVALLPEVRRVPDEAVRGWLPESGR